MPVNVGLCQHQQKGGAVLYGWHQRNYICIWSHQQWQDTHYDGEYTCTRTPLLFLGAPS